MSGSPPDRGPIRVGVSACLLGHRVRFDGGHKRDPCLVRDLGRFVEWVPVCPEIELGMGTPRPSLRLRLEAGEVRLVEGGSGRDHTRAMRAFARRRVAALAALDLCGYVLKRGSPSCGLERVELHRAGGRPRRRGRGLFAARLLEAMPHLPVEEEGRLQDAVARESFVERIFAYRRLRECFRGRWSRGAVAAFHAAHELQVLAHCPRSHAELGRLVAAASRTSPAAFRRRYEAAFMGALARRATPGRHANVLRRMAGHLGAGLDLRSRAELAAAIGDYRRGMAPLELPLGLLRHHARRLEIPYLLGQVYLDPHPAQPSR